MPFKLLPTLEPMRRLYQKPREPKRFQEDYLPLLQGNTKGDLAMPIGNWNPMAKEHILDKIEALQTLEAEGFTAELLLPLNLEYAKVLGDREVLVSLCIADDLKGGWTNRFTTDYDNRFKLNALVQRNFCTPLFWSSEGYDLDKIRTRILEACHRFVYWLDKPKPVTLLEHVQQELFVAQKGGLSLNTNSFTLPDSFFQQQQESQDYALIFNFMYGDEASRSLNFATFGNGQGWLFSSDTSHGGQAVSPI